MVSFMVWSPVRKFNNSGAAMTSVRIPSHRIAGYGRIPFWYLLGGLFFLASCHDAPRTNPFDPALTPAVELSVALDDTAGTATLTWSRYEGEQPFQEYRVLRNEIGRTRVDTLAHLGNLDQTAYVDTSLALDTDYRYWVEVVNAGGYAAPSPAQNTPPLDLPPVQVLEPEFASATASASLKWTRYVGPRFKGYQVLRRTEELAAQVVKDIPDIADTSLVDTDLRGNTEYFYRVVVVTERDEVIVSEERSGVFHQLLDTWPLEGVGRPFVRLYREGEGIAALITGATQGFLPQVRLYDPQGQFQVEGLEGGSRIFLRAMATGPGGERFFSNAWEVLDISGPSLEGSGILSAGADGEWATQEREPFADAFPEALSGEEGKVLGEISLVLNAEGAAFDNVAVSAGGRPLFAEDFSTFPEGDLLALEEQGWEIQSTSTGHQVFEGQLLFQGTKAAARRADPSWQDFRLEADVKLGNSASKAGIQVGGDAFSYFALWLDAAAQQAILDWGFGPPEGSGLEPKSKSAPISWQVFPGLPYHLSLEVGEGRVRASVAGPRVWPIGAGGYRSRSSLAAVGKILALTVDDQPFSVTLEGEVTPLLPLDAAVSEVRVWEGRSDMQMGVCLPQLNEVRVGAIPAGTESQWSTYLSRNLGPRLGPGQGFLFNPTSFDAGPDGRIYVLDAGNARVVVFDSSSRRYITQWGRQGSGPGEFDFGQGAPAPGGGLDFAGSLAVDSQGYIYVADELNKRIQKFAP
jgi:hypothetical protein